MAFSDHHAKETLQAVVLCDFDEHDHFRPLSHRRRSRATDDDEEEDETLSSSSVPNCLLPLANVALLDRTLEFLISNGAKEIFVVCGKKQREALEKHGKRRGGFLCESSSSAKKGNSGAGANATGSGFTIRLLQSANLVRLFIDFDGYSLFSRLCTLAIDLLRLFDGARCERPFDLPFTRMIITGNGRRRVAIHRAAASDQS
jgi:hypothetical protein|tara:strand:- start:3023 stop:3628 length:606 start_codon:yes stop_codon:yes gene_type:complete